MDGDQIIDEIPLHEILAVDPVIENEEMDEDCEHTTKPPVIDVEKAEITRRYLNTIQIVTVPKGFNSGRIYFIKADTFALYTNLRHDLSHLAKDARSRSGTFPPYSNKHWGFAE